MSTVIWALDAVIGGVVVVRALRRILIPTPKHPESHVLNGRTPFRAPREKDAA